MINLQLTNEQAELLGTYILLTERERAAKARACEERARDLSLSAVDRFFEQDDVEFWADTNRTLEEVRTALREAQLVGA